MAHATRAYVDVGAGVGVRVVGVEVVGATVGDVVGLNSSIIPFPSACIGASAFGRKLRIVVVRTSV
jgi:hypothetical protein